MEAESFTVSVSGDVTLRQHNTAICKTWQFNTDISRNSYYGVYNTYFSRSNELFMDIPQKNVFHFEMHITEKKSFLCVFDFYESFRF